MAFTVLVGYDGKRPSRAALDVTLGLADRAGGHVIIAHLVDGRADPRASAERHVEGQAITWGALLAAGNRGVPAEVLIADGPVADGLIRLAEERSADLLVVGYSGDSPLDAALTGSVCHTLAHKATLPIVMVPVPKSGLAA